MAIYPGSHDYEIWKQNGKIPENYRWNKMLYTTDGEVEDFQILSSKAYRKFYLRPRWFISRLYQIIRHPKREIMKILGLAIHLLKLFFNI
jgi:hypothetical protein